MTAPTEDLIELIERRIEQEFDGEAHFAENEARSIAQALRSLQEEVGRLRGDIAILDAERRRPGSRHQHLVRAVAVVAGKARRSALNTGSGEG